MKKYFLGFAAIALAVAFSAFTTPAKMFTSKNFRYTSSNYGSSDVSSLGNWVQDNSSFSCPSDEVKACGIALDEKYYYDDEGVFKINLTSATFDSPTDAVPTIVAEQGTTAGIYRVAPVLSGSTVTAIDNRD